MDTGRTRSGHYTAMADAALRRFPRLDVNLIVMAVVLGLAGGLVEGVGQMVLVKLKVFGHAWYDIIWIAAFLNALLVGTIGLCLAVALLFLPGWSRARSAAFFVVAFAASLPVLALLLKEWIHGSAILILAAAFGAVFARTLARREASGLASFRRGLPWMVALAFLTLAGIQGGSWLRERIATDRLPEPPSAAPNVLVIIIDTLRADHLSSYGYRRRSSPTLDRLAAEGVLFERAFSTSSYTLPSHASILNGLYTYQHGVEWDSFDVQGRTYPILPEALQAHGYRTGAFSGNTFWFTRAHGFGRGFLHFDDFFHSLEDMAMRTAYGRMAVRVLRRPLGWNDIVARKRATDTNRALLGWIDRDKDHPFFAVVNYMDVHDPYLPPQPYRSMFSERTDPGGLINWELHVPDKLTPDELQSERDAYDGSIAYVDDQIKALLASIQSQDATRSLLVVVTSDHGEEFEEHGGYLHGAHLYREVIHVPLILWQPGVVPPGVRVPTPVSNAAIPAAVMDLAVADDGTFPGPSLRRLWDGSAPEWPFPRAELQQRSWEPTRAQVHHGSLRSLVSPDWHYIEHDAFGPFLFDLILDPREANNLANQPAQQAVLERFRDQLARESRAHEEATRRKGQDE